MRHLFKKCRACEGRKLAEHTMRSPETGEEWKQILMCPFCKGKGMDYWGYEKEEGELTEQEKALINAD